MFKQWFIFLIVMLASIHGVQADTIHLKNGDLLSGEMISFGQGIVVFKSSYGPPLKFQSEDITSLMTEAEYEVVFVNGDRATGLLEENEARQGILMSENLERVDIEFSNVVGLVKKFDGGNGSQTLNKSMKPQQYGQQKIDETPLDFLTGSTVLLAPGQYELDVGMSYKQFRDKHSLYSVDRFQKSTRSARMFEVRSSLRAGLMAGIEGYVSVPVTYTHVEDVSSNKYVRDAEAWDVSDLGFGLQYQLTAETANLPAFSLTVDGSAPTGKKRYRDQFHDWKDPLDNGSGHWSVAPGLAFARNVDPAILFGGISYRYYFSETIDGYRVKPGALLGSYFGIGFGLNEKLSLGSRLSYAHRENMMVNREKILGSDVDPVELSFNASYRAFDRWVISPQITFGINQDAGQPLLALNVKRQFN